MKGVSREMFFRVEGKDVADKLYPQYKKITTKDGKEVDRTTSIKSDERTDEIALIIMSMINSNGYAIENEIVEELQDRYPLRIPLGIREMHADGKMQMKH